VEVKIGVQNASRELVLDSRESADDVAKAVAAALAEGEGVLTLTDTKGRTVLVPAAKLAYVEIGSAITSQVGFRS
jgi:mannose/fructose-specific phosphotransferase system component IIA